MAHHHHLNAHRHAHFGRDASPRAHLDVVADSTIAEIPSPVELVKRSSNTCDGSDSGGCQLPTTSTSASVPIAIGVIVPVAIALVLFIYLHRRHVKKLRLEDANDKTKSLDYGMDPSMMGGKKKKGRNGKAAPGAIDTSSEMLEKSLRGGRGLSMDIGNSPYLLPPEIHGSRESLHSLSRTISHGIHDPYRPATSFVDHSAPPSIYGSPRVGGDDDASTHTGSTGSRYKQDGMNQNLVRNAQRMSMTKPPMPLQNPEEHQPPVRMPSPPQPVARKGLPATPRDNTLAPATLDPGARQSSAQDANVLRQSTNYLAAFIHSREASVDGHSSEHSSEHTPENVGVAQSPPPRGQSLYQQALPSLPAISVEHEFPNSENYEFNEIVVPPSPDAASRARGGTSHSHFDMASPETDDNSQFYTPAEHEENPMGQGLGVSDVDFNSKRLSVLRPLPPDDPTDNPEQRANRIRSFYKEYFNENEARVYAPAPVDYVEDYGSEYMGDPTVFDPQSGQFVMAGAPYAEPIMRRAMTPPPRGPPRFQGPSHGYNNSNPGQFQSRSRAFSSASTSRMGPGPRGGPRPPVAPPKALRTLPTPHLLREDAFALPIDFAPPSTYKDRASGRPDSPLSHSRPFSPAVPIASPLASSFLELSAMPSPHLLRKSGTFTALDFAPPPRFKNSDAGSDNGSIRSGRSGRSAMSAAQVHNLRAGAYRVSRIPTDLVSTRNDLATMLKPTWQVHA